MTSYNVLIVFVNFVFLQYGIVTSLHIEVIPSHHVDTSTSRLTISCVPDDVKPISSILLLQISKGNDDVLTSIRDGQPVTVTDPDYQAVSQIDNIIASKSYLNLTIPSPDKQDGGIYKCDMYFLDENNLLQEDSTTANVTWDKLDPFELSANVETAIQTFSSKYTQIGTLMRTIISEFLRRLNELELKVQTLESNDQLQASYITKLEEKFDNQSAITELQSSMIEMLDSKVNKTFSEMLYLKSEIANQSSVVEFQTKKISKLEFADQIHASMVDALEAKVDNHSSQILDLRSEITVESSINRFQKSKIANLEYQIAYSKIKTLENDYQMQSLEISKLESKITNQTLICKLQSSKIESLEKKYLLQNSKMMDLEREFGNQSFRLTSVESTAENLQSIENSPVAFRVWNHINPGSTGIVKPWPMDSFSFKYGGAFNPSTGVFTAPTDGLYAFNFSIQIYESNIVGTDIRLNGKVIGWVHALDEESRHHRHAVSRGTVVYLKAGDRVYLDVSSWHDKTKYVDFYFSRYRVTKA